LKKMIVLTVGMLSVEILTLGVSANAATAQAPSQPLPQSTAIPVRFERSVDAKKAKPGDTVTAKTMQVIVLPGGEAIAKGTAIVGHVVTAQSFQFDSTPYAHQQPSTLSIHFDKLQQGVAGIPINLSVRAMAGAIDSQQATYPHSTDDTDHVGTMTLIGGTSFSPLEKRIQSDDGDAIGYNRKDGVFARLIPTDSSGTGTAVRCDGTSTEQSVAIFAPDACGVYGFGGVSMPANGEDGSGTFTLAVRGRTLKLYAGSTALLQVNPAK